jgi:dihydroorotase
MNPKPFWWMLLFSLLASAQPHDLVIKGGHVIDAKNGINGIMDVAITAGKIARVAQSIPVEGAKQVVQAQGLYVTPGLVDLHTHVYAGTGARGSFAGDFSIYPDGYTFRAGVTTVVDAGSSGWQNFPDFKDRVIDRSATRVLSMLNIVGNGMGGGKVEQNTTDMDAQATAAVAKKYPGVIVGIKTAHYIAPDWIAVDRAVEAGTRAGIPVMVDFGRFAPDRPYQELVGKHLRPGDMHTHIYMRDVPLFDAKGKLLPYLSEARKRGVKFDLGHGNASFTWNQAVPAIEQGFWPDSISTDAHIRSTNGGMKDMTYTMSKMLVLGVPFTDVIKMSTWNPAQQIKRPDLGHLTEGATADIAVFSIANGKFGYLDYTTARFDATQRITCELTIREGKVVWDLNGIAGQDWRGYYKVQ